MSPLFSSISFLQTQSDARLIALAGRGHERAFEALVKRYRAPLLAYCRRIAPSDTTAEDALQEALLQAWVALRTDAEVRDTRAWLYSIVHNVRVSNLRSTTNSVARRPEVPASSGADEEAERRMDAREALSRIATLPELQRDAMIRTVVDGLSHQELANELGMSRGAVRGLIYRARARLRAGAGALIPGLVIEWAARQGAAGPAASAGIADMLGCGGSPTAGGVLVRSGAIAAAGAVAAAVGITVHDTHPSHHSARGIARVRAGAGTRPDEPASDQPATRTAQTAAGEIHRVPRRPGIGASRRVEAVAVVESGSRRDARRALKRRLPTALQPQSEGPVREPDSRRGGAIRFDRASRPSSSRETSRYASSRDPFSRRFGDGWHDRVPQPPGRTDSSGEWVGHYGAYGRWGGRREAGPRSRATSWAFGKRIDWRAR